MQAGKLASELASDRASKTKRKRRACMHGSQPRASTHVCSQARKHASKPAHWHAPRPRARPHTRKRTSTPTPTHAHERTTQARKHATVQATHEHASRQTCRPRGCHKAITEGTQTQRRKRASTHAPTRAHTHAHNFVCVRTCVCVRACVCASARACERA